LLTRNSGQAVSCDDSATKLRKQFADIPPDSVDEVLLKAATSMPCIFYDCTSDLVITAVSPNTFEVLGIRPENFVGKRPIWQQRLSDQSRERLMNGIEQLSFGGFASQICKLTDDKGLPVWVAHSFRKVTRGSDWRMLGCMLPLGRECNAIALDDVIISQFVHKIGNHYQLMNFLIGSLQRSGMNRDEVEGLQQTVDRAVEFTRAFSHYSQPLAALARLDLCDLLLSGVKAMAPAFSDKNVTLSDLVEPALNGSFVEGDGFLLELAFRALLQNALEATQSGGKVVLSGRIDCNNLRGSVARVSILDTGSGIEKEFLAQAAEPFVSSKPDRDGLGLPTAIRIIEMHGGALRISSDPRAGTNVEILLPLSDGAESN
jgi:hypothetical protein